MWVATGGCARQKSGLSEDIACTDTYGTGNSNADLGSLCEVYQRTLYLGQERVQYPLKRQRLTRHPLRPEIP